MGVGQLTVKVTEAGGALPIAGAIVSISGRQNGETGDGIIYTLVTDESGITETVALEAPDRSMSLHPGGPVPYAEYDVRVTKEGYHPAEVAGTQIFDQVTALQYFNLLPLPDDRTGNRI